MREVSGSELAELTGKTWRTVKAAISSAGIEPTKRTKKSDLYDSEAVLQALYVPPPIVDDDEVLDPIQEKARRDKESADKLAMENAVRRGELARREDVVRFWTDCCANSRAKLLALPARIAAHVPVELAPTVHQHAKEIVYEALTELADYEPPTQESGG